MYLCVCIYIYIFVFDHFSMLFINIYAFIYSFMFHVFFPCQSKYWKHVCIFIYIWNYVSVHSIYNDITIFSVHVCCCVLSLICLFFTLKRMAINVILWYVGRPMSALKTVVRRIWPSGIRLWLRYCLVKPSEYQDLCVYVYIYIYIFLYTHIYIYINICIHMHIYI